MTPGFYVVRLPKAKRTRQRNALIVESLPFERRGAAGNWRDFIQSLHGKSQVLVIQVMKEPK